MWNNAEKRFFDPQHWFITKFMFNAVVSYTF